MIRGLLQRRRQLRRGRHWVALDGIDQIATAALFWRPKRQFFSRRCALQNMDSRTSFSTESE